MDAHTWPASSSKSHAETTRNIDRPAVPLTADRVPVAGGDALKDGIDKTSRASVGGDEIRLHLYFSRLHCV